MTLDERATRAVADLRAAVPTEAELARFHGARERRQRRRQRLAVVAAAVATAVIAAVATLVGRHVGDGSAAPADAGDRGWLLYGRWDPKQQESTWFTIRTDGTRNRSLHVTATCALWWPDGSKILITDDERAHQGHPLRPATIEPDGSGMRRLDAARAPDLNLGCGDVATNGSTIALEGFNERRPSVNGIYLVRASDGGGLRQLTNSPPGGYDAVPRFAPDGRRIVFLRVVAGASPEGAGALFVTNAVGGTPHQITPSGWAFLGYEWSPDGRWIVFQRPYGELYLVHPDGSGLQRIPLELPRGAGAQNPAWSPDGSRIAFSLTRNGHGSIYTVGLDGQHLRQVTSAAGADEQMPDWTR